jgi:hypothetical protein
VSANLLVAFTVVAGIAALGQFVVAFALYRLQLSNELNAHRIELFVRLSSGERGPITGPITHIVVTNLSRFAVWIDSVLIEGAKVVDEPTTRSAPFVNEQPFDLVVPSSGTDSRQVFELPRRFTVTSFEVTFRARGVRRVVRTNPDGGILIEEPSPDWIDKALSAFKRQEQAPTKMPAEN